MWPLPSGSGRSTVMSGSQRFVGINAADGRAVGLCECFKVAEQTGDLVNKGGAGFLAFGTHAEKIIIGVGVGHAGATGVKKPAMQ